MPFDGADIFVHVAREGSFTAAAKALDMPKSTVSLRIAALEQRLGVTLLRRTTRSLALTDAGQAYLSAASQALADMRAAEASLRQINDAPRGLLRIAGATNMGEGIIGQTVTRFMAAYPEIEIDMHLGQRRVDLLTEPFDIAIRLGALDDSSGVVARSLGNISRALLASPAFLATRGPIDHPRDIAPGDMIAFSGERSVELFHASGERFTLQCSGRFSSNRMAALRAQAVAGTGYCLLPLGFAGNLLAGDELVPVLPEWRTERYPIHVLYLKQKAVPARIRVFVDFLLASVKAARAG